MKRTDKPMSFRVRLICLGLFAVAMAYVEAAVVVYLREVSYPDGFSFPLSPLAPNLVLVEVGRELAAIVMLGAVAWLAASTHRERFAWFLAMFGVWDIWYYIWLKVTIDWPSSLFDWDVLYLIPLPWVAPVIAPVLVAITMTVIGLSIARHSARGGTFTPTRPAWLLAIAATALILYSFMRDTGATLHGKMPLPYPYWMLAVGLLLYIAAFLLTLHRGDSR